MTVGKLIWTLFAMGIAYGVNVWTRPVFDPHYAAAEYAQPTGSLSLSYRGQAFEVPLMTSHIVTVDVERTGRRYPIRELGLRAAGSPSAARLELYAKLTQLGGDLAGGAHDPAVLLQHELPIARAGRLGARLSQIVLAGDTPRQVISGSVMLTDLTPVSGGGPAYRALGRVEAQVETAQGVEVITGKLDGQLVWDP